MKKLILVLYVITLMLSRNNAWASVVSTPPPPLDVKQERRIVADVVQADLKTILPTENWFIAKLIPKPSYSYIPEKYVKIDAITKKVVVLPGAENLLVVSGTVKILTTLTEFSQHDFEYKLEQLPRFRSVSNSDLTPLLSDSSTPIVALCHRPKDAKDTDGFTHLHAIPDEWENFVLPAFKFQQANKSLFNDKNVVKNQNRLLDLTSDANPFNAIAAARVLAAARGLDAKFVQQNIGKSSGYQLAIFTYLAFKNTHPLQQQSIDMALQKFVDKATTSATLKWITLGLTTALNEDANSYFAMKDRVKAILLSVDKKQKELKTKTPEDEYLNELLISAQVRERLIAPPGKTSIF